MITKTEPARWRMPLGTSAVIKDQPALPQPSPRPDGKGNSFCRPAPQQGLHNAKNRNSNCRDADRRLVQTSTECGNRKSDNGQCERHPLTSFRTSIKCLMLDSLSFPAVIHFLLKRGQEELERPLVKLLVDLHFMCRRDRPLPMGCHKRTICRPSYIRSFRHGNRPLTQPCTYRPVYEANLHGWHLQPIQKKAKWTKGTSPVRHQTDRAPKTFLRTSP